jgi:coronin-1B/1C/6
VSPVERSVPPSRQTSMATPALAQSASTGENSAAEQENTQLKAELREAREKIRNLELQVESMKANMRKATEALLN